MKKRWWGVWVVAAGALVWASRFGMHQATAPAPFTFQGAGSVERLSLSPDGRLLAEDARRGQVTVYDTATGSCRYALPVQTSRMKFSSDGRRLMTLSRGTASSASNLAVQVWDAATGAALSRFPVPVGSPGTPPSAQPRVVATSADLREAVVRDAAHCAVYDVTSGRLLRSLPAPASRSGMALFSPDGHLLAVGSDRGAGGLQVWDTKTWQPLLLTSSRTGQVMDLRFSPDGSRLAFTDATSLCWLDTRTWTQAGRFALPKVPGQHLSQTDLFVDFSSDSRRLLVSQMGQTDVVHVLDCATGQETTILPNQLVQRVSMSGNRIQTVRLPRPYQVLLFRATYSILDAGRQQEIYRIAVPPGPKASQHAAFGGDFQMYMADFSADGHTFAVGGYDDGIIHVWHLP